ncbi:hypothetical protein [Mycoplasmopsis iners]|uniref:hypothetical protein n=1 Tax=Mycoplasmopsis iners TaxID=76630 RepID=UPI00049863E9|nr:hypothetical protein [Mycoplasmopsis iners]
MFYKDQSTEQQKQYKRMLTILGNLTLLFSESDSPYLPYRAHENIFCKYFEAENLARKDCSVDAKKGTIGIGLKTFTGNIDQKIAEFGKLKPYYSHLSGLELIKKIAKYRNMRIRVTKNLYNIDKMIYHMVRRTPGRMEIIEYPFDFIDIDQITIIENRGNINNTYFTDGKHKYHFSTSKNTLYMLFENFEVLDSFDVPIIKDPYSFLMNSIIEAEISKTNELFVSNKKSLDKTNTLCLRLYSEKNGQKFVPEKSGLNQWNANGRKRDFNEIYIPYNTIDRQRNPNFFPQRDIPFKLHLPNGTTISAKVCQSADKNNPKIGKAIMSNPNKVLGKWLLRDVFEIPKGTKLTYEMLQKYNIDSVIFTKIGENEYSIDFSPSGTYEEYYYNDYLNNKK